MEKGHAFPRSISLRLNPESSENFRCQRCGRCCHGPSRKYGIKLLYQEVRSIQRHLEGLMDTGEFEEFAWDYLTFFGRADRIGDGSFLHELKDSMRDFFFSVSQTSSDKKSLYVEYYVLKTYRDSGRCIFFNPLERSCLVHEVKPHTCRLYPFYAEIDLETEEIKLGSYTEEECPGLRCEGRVSILELGEKALSLAGSLQSHYSKLAELLVDMDPSKSDVFDEFYVRKLKYRLASPEHMREALSRIREEGYAGLKARDLFLEEGLIQGTNEYCRRLREG
jgi:Fe-S-cluster containining protein